MCNYTIAYAYHLKTLAAQEKRLGLNHMQTAVTLIRMGEWHETQGDKPSAELNYTQAVALLEEHAVETHYELKRVLENLVRVGK